MLQTLLLYQCRNYGTESV